MDNLTSAQKSAIEELRQRVKNDLTKEMLKDETLFYRFLKARDFKGNLAEEMLRKHISWRIANQVDTILTDYKPPEVLEKHFSYSFLGFSKEGFPVVYHAAGKTDVEGVLKSIKFSDVKRYIIYKMENDMLRLMEQSEKLQKQVTQLCYIYNLEFLTIGEGTRKKNIDVLLLIINMLQDHYPERMKVTYIINAPTFFTMILSVVKKIMAAALLQKLRIFGKEGWKEVLLEFIDFAILPAFLGGLKTDPDGNPYCNTFIIHGSVVPERYYICNVRKPLSEETNVKRKVIPERSKFEVPLDVQKHDSIIEWEYETNSGDIGFGLFFQESQTAGTKSTQLIPFEKMKCCEGSETGKFRCEKLGTYVITFDNSHSWRQSKEIFYKITIANLRNGENSAEN